MTRKNPTLEDAVTLSMKCHEGQKDKAGEPYFLHPLSVMLDRTLTNDIERMIAVLHDTIEDTGLTFERLEELGYPADVVEGLRFVTKLPEEEHDYDAFIGRVLRGPLSARKVKLVDLRHNEDLSRFANPSERDRKRSEKYRRAIARLEPSVG